MADERNPQTGRHPHVRRVFFAATAVVSAFVMLAGVVGMGAYFWTRAKIRTFDTALPAEVSPARRELRRAELETRPGFLRRLWRRRASAPEAEL